MANYRKAFNLRNGVQIDDDNFIVNSNGLVGIGTSIPTEFLDVRGNVKVVGHTTSNTLYAGIATVGKLNASNGAIVSGVVTASSFSGSASGLTGIYAIAVDGWYVDSVNSAISTSFKVGIGTTLPSGSFQVGTGVTVNSNGDASYSGIVSALSFKGQFSGNIDGNINSTGVSTFNSIAIGVAITASGNSIYSPSYYGTFYGDVVGNATNLTGTPNLNVGIVTATSIISGISTFTNTLNVGVSGTAFAALNSGRIGIGTALPTSELQIRKITGTLLEVISDSGQSRISIGQSVGVGKSTGILRYGYENKTLDLINNDTGNINMVIHGGPSGINTGRFSWIYGQTFGELASLTYDGKFGIGITNPSNNLHVVGTSTVTGNSFFGSNVTINGNLTVGSLTLPSLISNTNLNNTSGISTFYNLKVSNDLDVSTAQSKALLNKIGIGTTNPIADIDAQNALMTIGGIGIGTTALYEDPISNKIPSLQLFDADLLIYSGDLIFEGEASKIGFNTYTPRSVLDFGNVGSASTIGGYFIPPSITTIDRDKNTNFSGIGNTIEGAIIYNSTLKRHQGYGSTDNGVTFAWHNLY